MVVGRICRLARNTGRVGWSPILGHLLFLVQVVAVDLTKPGKAGTDPHRRFRGCRRGVEGICLWSGTGNVRIARASALAQTPRGQTAGV